MSDRFSRFTFYNTMKIIFHEVQPHLHYKTLDSFSDHENVIDFVSHHYSYDEIREIAYYLEDLVSNILSGSGLIYDPYAKDDDPVRYMFDILYPSLMLNTTNAFKLAQSLTDDDEADRFIRNLSDSQFDFSECLEKDTSSLFERSAYSMTDTNESIIYDVAVGMTFEFGEEFGFQYIPELKRGVPHSHRDRIGTSYEYQKDGGLW